MKTKNRTNTESRSPRGDTLVGTVEQRYGIKLGYRSDKKLATVLREIGAPSMAKLLEMADATKR